MSKPQIPKKPMSTRQAARVVLIRVLEVLPQVKPGSQAEVVDTITIELERLPLKRTKEKRTA